MVLDWTQHTLRRNCPIISSLQSQRLQLTMPSPFRLKPLNGSSGCGSSNCTVCIAERFFVQRHFRVMPLQWMKQLKLEPVLLCHLDSTTQADTESAIATTAREPTMHADHAIVQLVRPQLGIPHDQIVWHRFASRPAYDWSAPVLRMQGAGWVCRGL